MRTTTVDLRVQPDPVPQPVILPIMCGEASDVENKGFCDVIKDVVVSKPSPTVHQLGNPVHEF